MHINVDDKTRDGSSKSVSGDSREATASDLVVYQGKSDSLKTFLMTCKVEVILIRVLLLNRSAAVFNV